MLCLQYYTEETVYEEVPGEVRLGPHMRELILIREEPLSSLRDRKMENRSLFRELTLLCPAVGIKRPYSTFEGLIHVFMLCLAQMARKGSLLFMSHGFLCVDTFK